MTPLEAVPDVPKSNGALAPELSSDSRWRLVERILVTAPFQKSVNLHALLLYLATHSIQGKAESLTERQIGIAVFGKPAGYSPAEDSAVRVHVRQLRLRIHEYFAQEGRQEILRVDIPKGSYVLEFHDSKLDTSPRPIAVPEPAVQAVPPQKSPAREILFWITVCAAIVCSVGWYRTARAINRPGVPWPLNAVIQPAQQTRVVVSDSSTMLRELGQREITLNEYLQPGFRQSLIPPHLPENLLRLLDYISDSELTSYADLTTYSSLLKLAGPLGNQLVLTSARDLDRRDLEQGNFVFVGSPTSNPWVLLFADRLNFEEVEEGVGGRMYFRNRHPLPGEQTEYEGLTRTGSTGDDFATIAVLPDRIGQGNVMILQGLRQAGTEALSMLLADPDGRARLEKAVHLNTKGSSPYFEALVRSRTVTGAPVSLDIIAVRSIQP